MNKFVRATFLAFITIALFVLLYSPVTAQTTYRVNINYIDSQLFPRVNAYVSVTDAQGALVTGLGETDFSVSEDAKPISNFKVLSVENTQQPLAVALVIDTSGSMNVRPAPTPLSVSIDAAKAFLNSLQPQDQAAVIAYSDSPTVVRDFTQDKNALGQALDSLQGGTGIKSAMYDAIRNAVGLLKSRDERRVIILITDGKDTRSQATIDQAISDANQAGVQIYTIGFGAVVNHDQLYKLADQTGGSWVIQPNAAGLQTAFGNIMQVLREQYQVEYTSALLADNKPHNFVLTVTVQGNQVTVSKSFTAQTGKMTVTLPYQDGQVVGGNVVFNPTVTAPAPISKLDITMDGTPLTSIAAAPFEYTWTSTNNAGVHEFVLKVMDQVGNVGQASVRLNVQLPLTVKITQPSNGDQLNKPTTIAANVTSLPGTNVAKVDIAVDGTVIKTLTSPPYETNWDLNNVKAGPHTIQVTAQDVNGFSAEDKIAVAVALSDSFGWLIIPAALAVLAIVIPLSLRSRKRRSGSASGGGTTKVKAGTVHLRELNGMNPDQVWPLGTAEIRLGRKRDENDIPLQGLNASRRHAVIRFEQGQYIIQGLSANNPVIVNNEPISQPRALQTGDVIQLGDTTLRFEQS